MRARASLVLTCILVAAWSSACSSLLGIDEQYVVQPSSSSGGSAPASGGSTSTGGAAFFQSGAPGAGGAGGALPPDESGGAPQEDATAPPAADGGCDGAPCKEPDPCAVVVGEYAGTFSGQHTLLTPLPNLPVAPPVSGSVAFEIARDQRGTLAVFGDLESPSGAIPSFSARIEGTLDCVTGKLDAKLLSGQLTLTPLIVVRFEGQIGGTYDSKARTVNGDWTEAETPRTGAEGHGTWTVAWSGS